MLMIMQDANNQWIMEWYEIFDDGGGEPASALYEGPLGINTSLCFKPSTFVFYPSSTCGGSDQTVLSVDGSGAVSTEDWTGSCAAESFCIVRNDSLGARFGIDFSEFFSDDGSYYIVMTGNQEPTVSNFEKVLDKNEIFDLDLSAYAEDPDNDELVFELDNQSTKGLVELLSDNKTVRYTPEVDSVQPDSFLFRASDGQSSSRWASVLIEFNQRPITPDIHLVVGQYGMNPQFDPLEIRLRDYARDNESDPLVFELTDLQPRAEIEFDAEWGVVYYEPDGKVDPDSFGYRAYDGYAYSENGTVHISVNQAPVVTADISLTVGQNGAASTVDLGSVVQDNESDALEFAIISDTEVLVLTDSINGIAQYTPDGTIDNRTISFTVQDNFSRTEGFVEVTINQTPIISPVLELEVGQFGEPVDFDLSAHVSDPEGDELTFGSATSPVGQVSLNDGVITYTHDNSSQNTTISFAVEDGYSQPINGSIQVIVNQAPIVELTSLTIGQYLGDNIYQLADNATDAEGDPIVFSLSDGHRATVNLVGSDLTYSTDGLPDDDLITIILEDSMSTREFEIVVDINEAPVVQTTELSVYMFGGSVEGFLSDFTSDNESNPLTFSIDNSSTRGSVVLLDNATGRFSYTPDGIDEPDNFSYTANDGYSTSLKADILIKPAEVGRFCGGDSTWACSNDNVSTFGTAVFGK